VAQLLESEEAGLPWLVTVMAGQLGKDLGWRLERPVPAIWRGGV